MRARLTKVGAAVAALAALAVGGSALASAGSNPKPAAPPAAEQPDGTAKADTDTIQDENGKDDATEQSGSAENESAESGSEVAGDDGSGGWADEPGNPNANTQQEGEH